MKRNEVINHLAKAVPESYWLVVPTLGILLLPVGLPVLYLLVWLGMLGSARPIQALMIFSVLFGPATGVATLFLIKHSNISPTKTALVQWLARLSVVSPILILLTLFTIFSRP